MTDIQILLLTGILFVAFYFVIRLRKRLLDLVLMFIMSAAAIVFVIWPDLTNTIAKKLGVGRGADLIFYISIILFWFVVLRLYVRIRKLEQTFTEMIRKNAIEQAERIKT